MNARDLMATAVVSVGPDTPTRRVAALLLEKGISAVPVVAEDGAVLGMVSEGDLIGRDVNAREARRDWWLEMLAEGATLADAFVDHVKTSDRPVREVMTAPVVTVDEDTPARMIAELLEEHRIKRVPVIRDGRIVGIVSRADLVRALANAPGVEAHPQSASGLGRFVKAVDSIFHHDSAPATPANEPPAEKTFSATDFCQVMDAFQQSKTSWASDNRRAAAEAHNRRVQELLHEHVPAGPWRDMLAKAHEAATRGEKELLLLRFPSDLCADRGRKINVAEADWPSTLRGEPAEVYLHWERELRSRGFGIAASVLDFPGGIPGDIGLYLTWGD